MKWYEYALWFLLGYIPAYAITMLIMIVILKGCS